MTLMTSVALPVVRGPVQLAKILTAIDLLSDGRLIAAVGPGSSARDYALAGIHRSGAADRDAGRDEPKAATSTRASASG